MKKDHSLSFRMASPLVGMLCAFVLLHASGSHAATADGSHWALSLGKADYVLSAQGSVLDRDGAHVELASSPGRSAPTGSSVVVVDATAYRGYTVKLSGQISTTDAAGGAALWLRSDGASGSLTFANSQASPVKGTASAQAREVQIIVPPGAKLLVLGTLLSGDGRASVDHLSLVRGEAVSMADTASAQAELDTAIAIVKKNALHASSVDWGTLEPKLRAQIDKDGWAVEAYPAIRELLAALQDHHSHLVTAVAAHAMHARETPVALPTVGQPQDGVGYITLPGFNNSDPYNVAAYIDGALASIAKIGGRAQSGWVIDLRKDGGGSTWPMLAALRPFLGDSPLGYFKSPGWLSNSWKAQLDGMHPAKGVVDLSEAPLAVLTGPATASAGESVVIALKGRPHTRFFGQPTAGLPTGNRGFTLPDGAAIAVTTTVELDRNHVQYDGPITPDVTVAPEAGADPGADGALVAARQWLRDGAR